MNTPSAVATLFAAIVGLVGVARMLRRKRTTTLDSVNQYYEGLRKLR